MKVKNSPYLFQLIAIATQDKNCIIRQIVSDAFSIFLDMYTIISSSFQIYKPTFAFLFVQMMENLLENQRVDGKLPKICT